MENFIVLFIVGAAGLWGAFRLLRKRKAPSCSAGCGGCSGSAKAPPRLVTLRR